MLISPQCAESVVLAACVLHNMLLSSAPRPNREFPDHEDDVAREVLPGQWRQQTTMVDLQIMRGNNATNAAKSQRNYIRSYVNSNVGSVAWQENMA